MSKCDCGWVHGLEDGEHVCLSPEDELKAWRRLADGLFSASTNMNDTFGFATAEAGTLYADDIPYVLPLIAKYGHHAVTAYEAIRQTVKEGQRIDPITCRCCHDGPEYAEARTEMESLYDSTGPYGFMFDVKERHARELFESEDL